MARKKKFQKTRDERKTKAPEMDSTNSTDVKRSNRTNDISWYTKSEQSLRDSGSLSISDVLGLPTSLGNFNISSDLNSSGASLAINYDGSDMDTLPGVMALNWTPTIGGSLTDATTPVNVAALNIYSVVRHANSGHANYDAPDMMMYIMGVGSAFSFLAQMIRVYGTINVYNQRNRYMPKTLVEMAGFNYDDLVGHINDLRAYINHKVSEASVLWVPNTMPIIARWFWMNSNYFMDGESEKAQIYMYTSDRFLQFQNKTSQMGSKLHYLDWNTSGTGKKTFAEMVAFCESLFQPLISDEDIGIMAGDILKAYGADKIYGIGQISEDYIVLPVYDEEVLMQIHNCVAVSNTSWNFSDITQNQATDPAYISQTIERTGSAESILWDCGRRYLDFKGNAGDPAMVMIASRLIPICECGRLYETGTGTSSGFRVRIALCGSEVITNIMIARKPGTYQSYVTITGTGSSLAFILGLAGNGSKFEWAPMVYIVDGTTTGTTSA